MSTLYERLNQIDSRVKRQLVDALLIPSIAPRHYFEGERIFQKYRDELSLAILEYLRRRGAQINDPQFGEKIYLSFTPRRGYRKTTEPLLNILYGRIGGDHIPDEVFRKLEEWEALYFLPGIWDGRSSGFVGNRYTRTHLKAWTIREIVARTIIAGVKKLEQYEEDLGKKLPRKEKILVACNDALVPQLDLLVGIN